MSRKQSLRVLNLSELTVIPVIFINNFQTNQHHNIHHAFNIPYFSPRVNHKIRRTAVFPLQSIIKIQRSAVFPLRSIIKIQRSAVFPRRPFVRPIYSPAILSDIPAAIPIGNHPTGLSPYYPENQLPVLSQMHDVFAKLFLQLVQYVAQPVVAFLRRLEQVKLFAFPVNQSCQGNSRTAPNHGRRKQLC